MQKELVVWTIPGKGEGWGAFPSNGLLGMYHWMGLHFHDWTDSIGVTLSGIFNGITRMGSLFLDFEIMKVICSKVTKMGSILGHKKWGSGSEMPAAHTRENWPKSPAPRGPSHHQHPIVVASTPKTLAFRQLLLLQCFAIKASVFFQLHWFVNKSWVIVSRSVVYCKPMALAIPAIQYRSVRRGSGPKKFGQHLVQNIQTTTVTMLAYCWIRLAW